MTSLDFAVLLGASWANVPMTDPRRFDPEDKGERKLPRRPLARASQPGAGRGPETPADWCPWPAGSRGPAAATGVSGRPRSRGPGEPAGSAPGRWAAPGAADAAGRRALSLRRR